ncbi:MAG TPA: putative quinol monooxygenase [Pyrinomonadaceae bacterium]|jgi:quinol monooxygenase YgiN
MLADNHGAQNHMDVTKEKDDHLYVFARFHAKGGLEGRVEQAIVKVLGPTRNEPECLGVNMFRSVRDGGLFYIHSRWQNEAAFDWHGDQPYTKGFVDEVLPLIDHPLDVVRTHLLD